MPDEEDALFAQFGHRLASMMAVDDLLGRIVRALEERGELERTFILFTSDNGWFNGEHRLSNKGLAYEEAIRVPLFVRTPGRLVPRVESLTVLNNDLAPTLLDLAAGAATLPLDGRSLLPLLEGSSPAVWRERFVVEHFSGFSPGAHLRPVDPVNLFGIRTAATSALPNRAYVEYYGGVQLQGGYRRGFGGTRAGFLWQSSPSARELYSLDEDPFQIENRWPGRLSGTEGRETKEEAATLRLWMLELLSCSGTDCQTLENP
jgi:arylsulfatase A-like enzyme